MWTPHHSLLVALPSSGPFHSFIHTQTIQQKSTLNPLCAFACYFSYFGFYCFLVIIYIISRM